MGEDYKIEYLGIFSVKDFLVYNYILSKNVEEKIKDLDKDTIVKAYGVHWKCSLNISYIIEDIELC